MICKREGFAMLRRINGRVVLQSGYFMLAGFGVLT